MKSLAWSLLCALAHIQAPPHYARSRAYKLAEEITGLPWAACGEQEWEAIERRLK
jgi:hypothetical protein